MARKEGRAVQPGGRGGHLSPQLPSLAGTQAATAAVLSRQEGVEDVSGLRTKEDERE